MPHDLRPITEAGADPTQKIDLTKATPKQFAEVIALACRLGTLDATGGERVQRTGADLARLFCTQWLAGHAQALRAAYAGGRFHVDAMGTRAAEQRVTLMVKGQAA